MKTKFISIDNKGIILGNPLRFLDCHSGMTINEIQRSYNEITRIRLLNQESYKPQNDPYRLFDSIEITRYNAQQAYNILKDPISLLVSKNTYILVGQIEYGVGILANNLTRNEYKTLIRSLNDQVNPSLRRLHVFLIYVALVKGRFNNQLDYESTLILLRHLSSIVVDGIAQNDIEISKHKLDSPSVALHIWSNIIYDYIYHTFVLSLDDLSIGLKLQKAIETTASELNYVEIINKVTCHLNTTILEQYFRSSINKLRLANQQILSCSNTHYHKELSNVLYASIEEATKPIGIINQLYEDRYIDIKYKLQEVGNLIREISINVNNEFDDFQESGDILQLAEEFVYDDDLLTEYAKDLKTISNNIIAAESRYPSGVVEESGYLESSGHYSSSVGFWGGLHRAILIFAIRYPAAVFWITLIFIIVVISIFVGEEKQNNVGEEKQNNSYPHSSGRVSSTKSWSFKSHLKNTIDANKLKIRDMEKRLDELDANLLSKSKEIEEIENSLEYYETMINKGHNYYNARDSLYLKYERKISAYNISVRNRNILYNRYENLFDSTNNLIDNYNKNYAR